jgi:hypothetical protein
VGLVRSGGGDGEEESVLEAVVVGLGGEESEGVSCCLAIAVPRSVIPM